MGLQQQGSSLELELLEPLLELEPLEPSLGLEQLGSSLELELLEPSLVLEPEKPPELVVAGPPGSDLQESSWWRSWPRERRGRVRACPP